MKKNTGRVIINSLLSIVLMTVSFFSLLSEAQATEVKKESVASISEDVQETKTVTTKSGEISENDIEVAVEESDVSENKTETSSEKISDDSLEKASDFTADQAITWVASQVGNYQKCSGGIGGECVDLIGCYQEYLGVPVTYMTITGGAQDYANPSVSLPDGWVYLSGVQPQKGDILVYGPDYNYNYTGHVGIYESDYVTYHQNFNYHKYVERLTIAYNNFVTPYWGVVRPNFKLPKPPINDLTYGSKRTIPDGDYQIISAADDRAAIDVPGNDYNFKNKNDYVNARIWHNRGNVYDVFTIKYNASNGFYRIIHKGSNWVLDVEGNGGYQGDNVGFWKDEGNTCQDWRITEFGEGARRWYRIQSRRNGFYLDLQDGITNDDKSNIRLWEENKSDAQNWSFVPWTPTYGKTIEAGNYHIVSAKNANWCLGVNDTGNSGYPKNVILKTDPRSSDNTFQISYDSTDKYYKIAHSHSGNYADYKYLDIETGGDTTKNVGLYKSVTSQNNYDGVQKWAIILSSDGKNYNIVSLKDGHFLDIADGGNINDSLVSNGKGNIQVHTSNDGNWQKWRFIRAVDSVSLSRSQASIEQGKQITLTADVSPSAATDKTVTWTSSNSNVAVVSSSGVVTGKTSGNATITVKTVDGSKTATCLINVKPANINVSGVSLNKQSTTIAVGKTETLEAVIAPENATNKAVTWISSNPDVAAVDSNGVVTGKGAGTAVITVKTAIGGKTATCKVNVGTAPVITINSLPEAVYDKDYSAKIQASGTAPITFTITSGSLPGGFTLSDGTITGSPTGVCGVSTFTVQAKNAYGITEKKLSMEVVSMAKILHLDGEELMEGTVGEWYNGGISREGTGLDTSDYICSVINGALPDGLKFDNGTITGTPTRAGKYTFTVKVENKYGNDTKQLSIIIKASDGSEPEPVPDEGSDIIIVAGQKIKLKDVCFDEYDGKIARYKVDDKNIASVSKGMLTGKKAGAVKVTAQVSVGKNKYEDVAECTVTILSRPKLKFTAPMTYDGQTVNAPDFFTTEDTAAVGASLWESSNPKVVDVTDEEAGTLQAHKNGSAKITAYFGEKGKAGTLKVTATLYVKKPAFSKKEYTVLTGGKLTLSMKNVSAAMNPEWKAEDESVIRVTPQTNKKGDVTGKVIVEGLSSGDTTLTATIDGQEYACEIHVPAPVISRSAMNLKQGKSFTLALKSTKLRKPEIDWYTSDPDVATVDTNGKVIAIGEGEAIIYTETGGVLNECTVKVK